MARGTTCTYLGRVTVALRRCERQIYLVVSRTVCRRNQFKPRITKVLLLRLAKKTLFFDQKVLGGAQMISSDRELESNKCLWAVTVGRVAAVPSFCTRTGRNPMPTLTHKSHDLAYTLVMPDPTAYGTLKHKRPVCEDSIFPLGLWVSVSL